jgi:hypothetical protein
MKKPAQSSMSARLALARLRDRAQRRYLGRRHADLVRVLELTNDFTLPPQSRRIRLYREARRLMDAGVEGCFAEMGVYRGGGSAMLTPFVIAGRRPLHLFDHWDVMPEPTPMDGADVARFHRDFITPAFEGVRAHDWRLDAERLLIETLAVPADLVHFHEGLVQETLPEFNDGPIGLVHVDLDFYEATRFALDWLDGRLSRGAAVVLDDWQSFAGVGRAYADSNLSRLGALPIVRDGQAVLRFA